MVEVDKLKQIIVMRTDLGMRKGKMIAQGCHASLQVIIDAMHRDHEDHVTIEMTNAMHEWAFGSSFTKICVRVESEEELDNIFRQAQDAGIVSSLVVDSGRTEFHGVPTKTCCAIGPDLSSKIDPITRDLKLL